MAIVKSPGLVLRKTPFSETSVILKAFTRESGLITLMAKGAKRPRSKFRGLLDFFTLNQFLYSDRSKSEILTLTDAALIRDFPKVKADPAKQALGHVFSELYLKFLHGPEQSLSLYDLMTGHLLRLEENPESASGYAAPLCDFLLNFCAVSGFSPQFARCAHCGREVEEQSVRMDPELGGPVCRNCPDGSGGKLFGGRVLNWLRALQEEGIAGSDGYLSRSEEAQAEDFLLDFLGRHAGGARPIKSLAFYRQMTGAA